jgi:hypothetical protein
MVTTIEHAESDELPAEQIGPGHLLQSVENHRADHRAPQRALAAQEHHYNHEQVRDARRFVLCEEIWIYIGPYPLHRSNRNLGSTAHWPLDNRDVARDHDVPLLVRDTSLSFSKRKVAVGAGRHAAKKLVHSRKAAIRRPAQSSARLARSWQTPRETGVRPGLAELEGACYHYTQLLATLCAAALRSSRLMLPDRPVTHG